MPPEDKWPTILDNARAKAAAEAVKAFEWAAKVPKDRAELALSMADEIDRDAVGFIQRAIQKLSTDPTYAPQLRSLVARQLAASRGTQAPDMVPVQLEDGSVVQMPRDPAAWLAYHQQQWLDQVQQKLAPLEQAHAHQQQAAAEAAEAAEAKEFGRTRGQDAKTWPGMDVPQNVADLKAWLAEPPLQTGDPREVELLLNAGYRSIVLPRLNVTARTTVISDLNHKATANTANPNAATTAPPKPLAEMDWADALRAEHGRMVGSR